MKTTVKAQPWARGGRLTLHYQNPSTDLPPLIWQYLVILGPSVGKIDRAADCKFSEGKVESIVLDHKDGTLLTLVNWTNGPVKDLEVQVRMKDAPKTVRTVSGQRNLAFTAKDGVVTFRLDLAEADYVMLIK